MPSSVATAAAGARCSAGTGPGWACHRSAGARRWRGSVLRRTISRWRGLLARHVGGVARTPEARPGVSAGLRRSRPASRVGWPSTAVRLRPRRAKTLPSGTLLRGRVVGPHRRILRRVRITLAGRVASGLRRPLLHRPISILAPSGLPGKLLHGCALPRPALHGGRGPRRRRAGVPGARRLEGALLLRKRDLFRRFGLLTGKESRVGGGARGGW